MDGGISWGALAVFVGLAFAAASSGAFFRPGAWYAELSKPAWTPPNWAFPLVWSVLYLAIAASGYLIWATGHADIWPALAVYGVHLVINAAWSALFFGLRRLDFGMAGVATLWLSIAATIALFAPIDRLAAFLLTPYLAWVTIAAALNWRMLQLNGPRGA
jgi:tryptophan-rich sensory protein